MFFDRNNHLTSLGEAFASWHARARGKRVIYAEIRDAFTAGWRARDALINSTTGVDLVSDHEPAADGRESDAR